MAVNCSAKPLATLGFTGVNVIEVKRAAVTVSVVVPLTVPDVAVMVEDPTVSALASPVADTVAIATLDEVQVAELVRMWLVPSV